MLYADPISDRDHPTGEDARPLDLHGIQDTIKHNRPMRDTHRPVNPQQGNIHAVKIVYHK